MAEKSLVNDEADMAAAGALAVPAADDVADAVVLALELALELELDDDELPQPAISTAASSVGANAHFPNLIELLLIDARARLSGALRFLLAPLIGAGLPCQTDPRLSMLINGT
jgi:hypothetical protein